MKSIYEQIQELTPTDWNYYAGTLRGSPPAKPLVTSFPAIEFIRSYFKQAGKEWITEQLALEKLKTERADHTAAVFFVGILLLKNTGFSGCEFFPVDVGKWYDLRLFLWFVTCLAHDVAYNRETDERRFAESSTVDGLYDELHVSYRLFDQPIGPIPQDILSCCASYFTHRYVQGFTDHGLYAGVKAYDVLVKNRKEQEKTYPEDSLYWKDDLDVHYALAAATIATHNIWLPKLEQAEEYRSAGLDALSRRGPIAIKEGPMLYFLGLIDTIDVVKAYGDRSVEEVLKNSYITFTENSFTLTVQPPLAPVELKKRAQQAQDWLRVDITEGENWVTFSWTME